MRKHRTLAMMWPESDVFCLCCKEPLLIIPTTGYLACRWSGEVSQDSVATKVIQMQGSRSLPCPVCDTRRVKEARLIRRGVTHIAIWCSCGYTDRFEIETVAEHFLPVGYHIEWLEPPKQIRDRQNRYDEIKQAVLEVMKERGL